MLAFGLRLLLKLDDMKAKVIIENGKTEIVLTPENVFETSILEDAYKETKDTKIQSEVKADYSYSCYQNHRLIVDIIKPD